MKFLIDENVRKEVIDFLRSEGHVILNVPTGSPDDEVAKLAKRNKGILLTHDHHFANTLVYPPHEFSGIIRIKITPPNAGDILSALKNLLKRISPEAIEKRLVILEEDGFRIR